LSSIRSLYIDRGVLLNLGATGHLIEILETLPYRCIVLDDIYKLPLLLWTNAEEDEESSEREEISITSLTSAGILEVEQFEREGNMQAFVAFAFHVRDQQAKLLTLAEQHWATLATDDKRLRKVLNCHAPHVSMISTLTCLYTWQTHLQQPDEDLRSIARNMAQKAQFTPSEDEPLAAWWRQLIS
jgi:hypothetical protein